MVHLVILCCAGASVAPQLAAELVQASIFVLIEATQAVRPASSPLPHRGRQLPGPFACVRCTAQTSCSRRLSHRVTDFCVSLRWCLWWCAVCPRGRSEWGSASAVTFHRPCMVMGGVWKHSERPRSAAATARAQGSSSQHPSPDVLGHSPRRQPRSGGSGVPSSESCNKAKQSKAIICRWNVTRCPSCRALCTSSERQKEAWPGLTSLPTVPGALEELRFHATVICSIQVSMGSIWGLFGGPGRRRDFVPER